MLASFATHVLVEIILLKIVNGLIEGSVASVQGKIMWMEVLLHPIADIE